MRAINIALTTLIFHTSVFAKTVGLEEVLEHASQHSKTLALKQTEVLIEGQNIKSAQSAYYPSLNLVYIGEYNRALDGGSLSVESVGGTTIASSTEYQNSLALQLQYDLYRFGATDKQVAIISLEQEIKQKERCLTEQQLYQSILDHYSKALKAKEEKRSKIKMLDLRKQIYRMKERLYKAGEYSKVDLGDEAISIVTLQSEIENALMEYKENLIRLGQLSTLEIDEDVELLPLHAEVDAAQQSKNFEATIEAQKIQTKIAQKKEELTLNLRQQFPSFGMHGNYYFYGSDDNVYKQSIENMHEKSWNIGVSLRFNIFEGFKHSTAHERLLLEVKKLEQEYEQAEHDFKYESKSKKSKLAELLLIHSHEEQLLEENRAKKEMLKRLRQTNQIDYISCLSFEYEYLQHAMQANMRKTESAYESLSYKILNRGLEQCTQP